MMQHVLLSYNSPSIHTRWHKKKKKPKKDYILRTTTVYKMCSNGTERYLVFTLFRTGVLVCGRVIAVY